MRRFRPLLPVAIAAVLAVQLIAAPKSVNALTNCTAHHPVNDSEELAFLDIINAYRADHGLQTLTISTNLNREAAWMVNDMTASGYFGHYDSLGRHPWVRSVDCGYPIPAGENLAAGWKQGGAQAAFDLFKSSPTHNSNMLYPDYRQIGIARVYVANSQYGWYWATDFGTTDDGTGPASATAAAADTPVPVSAAPVTTLSASANTAVWRPVVWDGAPAEPMVLAEGGADANGVAMVYRYDAASGTWSHYSPELPDVLNTLDDLSSGGTYLVVSR
jgi:uncharacterized protein YkwD